VWLKGRPSIPRLRRATGVDSHDVEALRPASRRTRLVRLVLVTTALVLVAAAAATAGNLETREKGLLPSGATGLVVVDLSLSIADEDYDAVRRALRRLIAEDASIGLVVFSDVPYELLPPGTPASEMKPMLRLLVPPKLGPPINPWAQAFRAGTRISAALDIAKEILERDRVEDGAILLVSDLETAPDDVPQLARTVSEIRDSEIDLRVYPLAPSSHALVIFEGLLEKGAFAAPPDPGVEEALGASDARSGLPMVLFVLGGLLFATLAVHEAFGGRLAVPRLQRAQ
jgi:hypothetical protein